MCCIKIQKLCERSSDIVYMFSDCHSGGNYFKIEEMKIFENNLLMQYLQSLKWHRGHNPQQHHSNTSNDRVSVKI